MPIVVTEELTGHMVSSTRVLGGWELVEVVFVCSLVKARRVWGARGVVGQDEIGEESPTKGRLVEC